MLLNNNDSKIKKAPKNKEIFEDYTCMLNLTDVSYGVKGHNKFY